MWPPPLRLSPPGTATRVAPLSDWLKPLTGEWRSAMPPGRKSLFARKGILNDCTNCARYRTSARLLTRPSETLIAPALCMLTAAMYSSGLAAGLLRRSRRSCFVMPNAASPAPGLQKQPVRNEMRAWARGAEEYRRHAPPARTGRCGTRPNSNGVHRGLFNPPQRGTKRYTTRYRRNPPRAFSLIRRSRNPP